MKVNGKTVAGLREQYEGKALVIALQGMDQIKAFFDCGLTDKCSPVLFQKARLGAVVMTNYTRYRATRASEKQLRLIQQRFLGDGGKHLRALPPHRDG